MRGWLDVTLDLGLDIVDRVRGLDFERDGLAREGLDEDLHDGPGRKEGVSKGRDIRM